MTEATFEELLEGAQEGDENAWSHLYRGTAPVVLGYLRARRAVHPEDLLGEVFLQIARDISGFTGTEREFRAWAFTIARNRLVDASRRSGRRVTEVPAARTPEVVGGNTETEVLERLASEEVRALIGNLPGRQQDVILLRVLGDLTVNEIAEILGKRPGAVKALQRRALARLRRDLG